MSNKRGNGAMPFQIERATVMTMHWNAAGVRLAQECMHWRMHGTDDPDWYHMLGAAHKLGYEHIDDSNVAIVEAALRGYGIARQMAKDEAAERQAKRKQKAEEKRVRQAEKAAGKSAAGKTNASVKIIRDAGGGYHVATPWESDDEL